MTFKVLMVDVDGVLVVHPPGQGWADNLHADLGLDPERLQEAFFAPHFEDIVHGRADLHDRLGPVLAKIAPHLTSRQLTDYWFAADAALDHALLADLAEVRAQGVAVHLATVQEHHRARFLWRTLGLQDHFDAMHYAADLGFKKPSPGFYAEIGRRTGRAAHELRLIDDRPENVEGAIAAGWSGFHWTPGCRLADALR